MRKGVAIKVAPKKSATKKEVPAAETKSDKKEEAPWERLARERTAELEKKREVERKKEEKEEEAEAKAKGEGKKEEKKKLLKCICRPASLCPSQTLGASWGWCR